MFGPGARIIDPEFGDMTADILEELQEMARLKDGVILEREAAEMAAASGQVARDLCCGRLVAEFPEEVYDAWVQREGKEFFSKRGGGMEYLTKHFPQCRVMSKSPNVKLHVKRSPVTGRRGRWACPVPCAA